MLSGLVVRMDGKGKIEDGFTFYGCFRVYVEMAIGKGVLGGWGVVARLGRVGLVGCCGER